MRLDHLGLDAPPCSQQGVAVSVQRDHGSGAARVDSTNHDGLLRDRFAAGADQAWADGEDGGLSCLLLF